MLRRGTFAVVAVVVLAAASLPGAAPARAGGQREIVAFGDSLTDMGNRWLDPKKPDVKFRPTWVARLAGPAMLDCPEFKPSGTASFYGGTNYAVGGAGTAATADLTLARNRGQDLTRQVSGRYLNPAFNPAGVRPDALHVVVIGANDLVAASAAPAQILARWAGLDAAAVAVARSAEGQVDALANAGVKRVLWGNVFDVSRAPALRARATALLGDLAPDYLAAVSRAVGAHNAEMDAAVARLRAAHPGLELVKLDLSALFAALAADPAKYGLADVTTGANDDRHLFSADGLHPTPRGHQLVAEFALDVLSKARAAPAR